LSCTISNATLGTYTLRVKNWKTNESYLGSQNTEWNDATDETKRNINVVGKVVVYILQCNENNVAWGSLSAAKFLSDNLNNTTLVLNSTLPVRAVSAKNVKVIGYEDNAENEDVFQRYYSVELQEV
jgi:hypothetical protein